MEDKKFLFDSEDEKYATLQNMDTYGGGFVKKLAILFRHADRINQYKILSTWPELFKKYHSKNWK